MRIIGCDLHARQQTLAMLDTTTGEIVNTTLLHEGDGVREFYSKLPRPVRVGVEATGFRLCTAVEGITVRCEAGIRIGSIPEFERLFVPNGLWRAFEVKGKNLQFPSQWH